MGFGPLALIGLIGSFRHSGVIISIKLVFVNLCLPPQLIHIRHLRELFDDPLSFNKMELWKIALLR